MVVRKKSTLRTTTWKGVVMRRFHNTLYTPNIRQYMAQVLVLPPIIRHHMSHGQSTRRRHRDTVLYCKVLRVLNHIVSIVTFIGSEIRVFVNFHWLWTSNNGCIGLLSSLFLERSVGWRSWCIRAWWKECLWGIWFDNTKEHPLVCIAIPRVRTKTTIFVLVNIQLLCW